MAKGNFPACHSITAQWEGGYADHSADPGGSTNWGITIGTLSKWRGRRVSKAEVKALTRSEAEQIYKAWYWNAVKADKLPAGVDLVTYDYAVNSGPSRAARALQAAAGLSVVQQDGVVGPITLAAVEKAKPVVVVNAVCDSRLRFLKRLSHWNEFGNGWSNRVHDVLAHARDMTKKPTPKPSDPTAPKPNPGTKSILALLAAGIAAALAGWWDSITTAVSQLFGG